MTSNKHRYAYPQPQPYEGGGTEIRTIVDDPETITSIVLWFDNSCGAVNYRIKSRSQLYDSGVYDGLDYDPRTQHPDPVDMQLALVDVAEQHFLTVNPVPDFDTLTNTIRWNNPYPVFVDDRGHRRTPTQKQMRYIRHDDR